MRAHATVFAVAMLLASCATYQDELRRGQHAFEQNAHERALAIFRGLEPYRLRLSPTERAQYAYLRGMTDYRIGYRLDARHWLLLARAEEGSAPGALPIDWSSRLGETLGELNDEVHSRGIESLVAAPEPGSDVRRPPKKKAAEEDEP